MSFARRPWTPPCVAVAHNHRRHEVLVKRTAEKNTEGELYSEISRFAAAFYLQFSLLTTVSYELEWYRTSESENP